MCSNDTLPDRVTMPQARDATHATQDSNVDETCLLLMLRAHMGMDVAHGSALRGKTQHSATCTMPSTAPAPFGTQRNASLRTMPYMTHNVPLTTFMAHMGSVRLEASRVRST